jgi:hypothetical protein
MFAFLAGVTAGLVHVFSGPDHLAAIAPLASENNRQQWKTGLQWGVGHTAGVLLIGLLLLLLREQLPLDLISAHSERIVGVALILVGGWGVWRAMRLGVTPARDGGSPAHGHSHSHRGASFAMGTLHGLAGSSHLFGVLPAIAMPTRGASILYLAGFGLGAIAGMTAFAAAMGMVSQRLGRHNPRSFNGLLYVSSAAALVVGGVWLVGP